LDYTVHIPFSLDPALHTLRLFFPIITISTMADTELVRMNDPVDVEAGQGNGGSIVNKLVLPPDPVINRGFLKPIPETTNMERFAGVVAAGAVATALAAMVVEGSVIVIFGGILSSIVAPYAYWQETRLTDIKALKETEQAIQVIVDSLQVENQRLAKSVDAMTETVTKLDDVEQALAVITQTQGNAVETLSKQVEENKENLRRMRSNVKGDILRNLLSLFQRIDTDGDAQVSDSEVNDCIRRMKSVPNVTVREEKFKQSFQGVSTRAVMGLVKNLLQDDLPEEEKIFVLTH
jgi:hypothetical protein